MLIERGKMMEKELVQLGLLDKNDVANQNPQAPLYKKYFMHGTSHYLGLDVHDVGLWNRPLEASTGVNGKEALAGDRKLPGP